MAIALDSDFRSVLGVPAVESPRVPPASPESGEDFVASLQRARRNATDETAASPEDPVAVAPGPVPLLTATWTAEPAPGAGAEQLPAIGTPVEPALLTAEAPVEIQSDVSELKTDRELVQAEIKAVDSGKDITNPVQPALLTTPVAEAASTELPTKSEAQVAAGRQNAAPAEVTSPLVSDEAAPAAATGLVVTARAIPVAGVADKPAAAPTAAAPKAGPKTANTAEAGRDSLVAPSPAPAIQPDSATLPVNALVETAQLESGNSSASGSTAPTFTAIAPASGQQTAPLITVPATPFSSPNPILVAVPAEIVDIVSKTAEDGQSDRVVVQLDPPELGRVSIDFKFDAQGVQHVIITSETPEAMRQLRQMHAELVQALERQGIGSQNMTFQHQQQNPQQSPLSNPLLRMGIAAADKAASSVELLTAAQPNPSSPRLPAGGRLDIRL